MLAGRAAVENDQGFHWLLLSLPPIAKHLGVAQSLTCLEGPISRKQD